MRSLSGRRPCSCIAPTTVFAAISWKKAIVSDVQMLNTVRQDLLGGLYNAAVDFVAGDGSRHLGGILSGCVLCVMRWS
jgi:hypothetical protein